MARELRCRDVGFDCEGVIQGENDDEVMRQASEHGRQTHNLKDSDMTPDLMQKIKGAIRGI